MTYKMTYKISSSVHVVGYTFRGEKKGAMIVVIDDHNASIAAIYPSKIGATDRNEFG